MSNLKYIIGKNIVLNVANINDIDMIMKFQTEVINNMSNKDLFCPLLWREFQEAIENGLVYLLYDENIFMGLAVLNAKPSLDIIEEYDLKDISGIGILDSVMIKKEYRGSKLQQQIVRLLDNQISLFNLRGVVATVHPNNIWSLNNLLECDYKEINRITIHGGERIILFKKYK